MHAPMIGANVNNDNSEGSNMGTREFCQRRELTKKERATLDSLLNSAGLPSVLAGLVDASRGEVAKARTWTRATFHVSNRAA
jgi:hypothetical protein